MMRSFYYLLLVQLDFRAGSDNGRERDHNEDAYLADRELGLFVVADGMGGHAAGDVASRTCVDTIREVLNAQRDEIQHLRKNHDHPAICQILDEAVQEAGRAILQKAKNSTDLRGMGTTCSMLLISGERGAIAHVGDSRVYLIRKNQVHQLTEDHSLRNELIKAGKYLPEEFDKSPYKEYEHAITRAVGVYESVVVDTLDFDILPGDRFLLCSDGLHGCLDDAVMLHYFPERALDDSCQKLIAGANEAGGHDNITAIVIELAQAVAGEEDRVVDITQRLEALRNLPLFRYLNYKELVDVLNIAVVKQFEDGSAIIREGDEATEMFIILEGAVRLHKADTFISRLERGSNFGEMALVDRAPRSASATAEGNVRLLTIHADGFFDIIRSKDKLATKILWNIVKVLTARLRRTTAELSGALLEANLPDLSDQLDDTGVIKRVTEK